ncbi:MAG: ROK family protein [Abditibacteriota bacterium]|nr:ROK family protein [Abditibacteriota bacterium]
MNNILPIRNTDGGYAVGIDLGGTTVTASAVSHDGNILSRIEYPSLAKEGMDATCRQISEAADKAVKDAGLRKRDVIACGMGTPGVFDAPSGDMFFVPNFKEWDGKNLYQALAQHSGYKYYIGNDVNAAAFGEYFYGAGKESRAMVMFTMGTGIGSGVIIDGKPLRGVFASPEMGHIVISEDGPRCVCGARGCLEAYCGRDAIIARCLDKLQGGASSGITELQQDRITPKDIDIYAERGDELCLEVLRETGHYMGLGVANAINIFNPDLIVIGGGVGQSETLFEALKATAFRTAIPSLAEKCRVIQSPLDNMAGVLGAAGLAYRGEYA